MLFEQPLDRFPDLFPISLAVAFASGKASMPHTSSLQRWASTWVGSSVSRISSASGPSEASAAGRRKASAPQRDWQASRLGPMPPDSMATIRKDAFEAVLATCRTPPSLFVDSDGTSQREAMRRWHLGTVLPLARMLEHELTMKLDTPVELKFDTYALDMVSRATVVAKLAQAGVPMATALEAVGLGSGE